MGFLMLNTGRRLGQIFLRARRVPITVGVVEDHRERCSDALHEAHENAQHRLQRKLDERGVT